MDRIDEARLAWQKAQAELQMALSSLEKCVADGSDAAAVSIARKLAAVREEAADLQLHRYLTQLGKDNG
jgi:hypothetical protein